MRRAISPTTPVVTSQALGEEGDQADDVEVTSDALGEEGDQLDDVEVTSQALGEEGDQADDQPVESGWETTCTSMSPPTAMTTTSPSTPHSDTVRR